MKTFIILFVLLVIALVLVLIMLRVRELEMENQMRQAYMDSMEGLYSAIQERIEATRRYRHDLAKHIQTLEVLLAKKNQDMQLYLDELKNRYEELRRSGYCRDDFVDSILLAAVKQCEEAEIPLKIQVEDAIYGEIQEIDLVGLLYNLLDNAREANVRIPDEGKRGISFAMGKYEKSVWIEIENCFSAEETMDFRTKKKGKDQHGIGMQIIDSIIEKYHGQKAVDIDEEHHLLKEKIILEKE